MTTALSWFKDEFCISTDKTKLDIRAIHLFLSTESYWSKGIPQETVQKGIENSLCFGVYKAQDQIGFARVISDFATFAYLADVYILENYRGKGLAKWLIELIKNHPDLQGLRRWMLVTRDAQGLYQPFGWTPIDDPSRFMEIVNKNVYQQS